MTTLTSAAWAEIHDIVIMDPDGWDRKNFEYSFNEELITEEEFFKRASESTTIRKNL